MQRDELRQEIANKIPLSEYDGTKVSPTKSYFCAEKCIFQDLPQIYWKMTQFSSQERRGSTAAK